MLWERAERDARRPAIVEPHAVTDFLCLRERAAGVAAALSDRVRPGDRVAVFLERGASAAAAFFGVAAAGGIAVILNETLRPRQIEYVLNHSRARVLLTSAALLSRQPRPLETDAAILDVGTIAPAPGVGIPAARVETDVAQIIYTSGSTGLPKGVTVTHGNLWAGMRAVTSYLAITRDDRIASLLPFSFDYGFNQLLCAVGTGAALVVEWSHVPQHIATALRERAVTVLPAVPPLWLQLLTAEPFTATPIESLRVLTNTGGRLPREAIRKLRGAHPHAKLVLMYGLTEAFRSTYLPAEEVDRRPDSIGRAIPGAEILVVREDLTPCDPEEVGELVHRGPTVTLGYWADPEGTARVFRPNPLRPAGTPDGERVVFSGDLVRRDAEGFLYFVGRRDRMIKTLGYRVSPDEVAETLYASGEVDEAVVTSEPDDVRGERIVAHVVLAGGGSLDRLRQFCRVELPRYMQPDRFDVRDALPRTGSGKHDPRALLDAHDLG
jgi:amino acid adenylation domain-containing protein